MKVKIELEREKYTQKVKYKGKKGVSGVPVNIEFL